MAEDPKNDLAGGEARMEGWAQKLLDLSKANRLLNIRQSAKVMPLAAASPAEIEDAIAKSETLRVKSFEAFLKADEAKEFSSLAPAAALEKYAAPIAKSLKAGELWCSLTTKETDKRLKELYRATRADLEDGGVNTLFLALGVLEWAEKTSSRTAPAAKEGEAADAPGNQGKTYRAPIILVPVRIERARVADGYRIRRIDEDASVNATLLELLRREYSIDLGELDPPPMDEAGVDVAKIFAAFREAAANTPGMAVSEECWLGQFSFGKFVMWKDLTARMEAVAANPIVRHLLVRGGRYDDGIEVFSPEDVAAHTDYSKLCCPMGADSSQLAAVLYSGMGKSFVLHGPPGTGKSQTITNMIAHNLWLGRRVLFVSEKKAALDVVYTRLARLGLAPFCLQLHSNKSGKAEVYAQYKEALDLQKPANADVQTGIDGSAPDPLSTVNRQLDAYVAALHKKTPSGFTPYMLFARLVKGDFANVADFGLRAAPNQAAGRPVAKPSACTKDEYEAACRGLAALALVRTGIAAPSLAALACVRPFAWTPAAEEALVQRAADLARRFADALAALSPAKDAPATARLKGGAMRCMRSVMRKFKGENYELPAIRKLMDELAAIADTGSCDADACRAAAEAIAQNAAGNLRRAFMYFEERRKLPPVAAGAANAIDADDAPDAEEYAQKFATAFQAALLDEILEAEPEFGTFSGLGREALIKRLRELDDERAALSLERLKTKLAAQISAATSGRATRNSELGLLMHECGKKMRHKPVRQILAETPNLTPQLKPCFLMSPLSVAQYLGVGDSFDLVVFDEASQIPVWDAIGVIARARQLVMVGDPKQLPPTNFFHKGAGEDEVCEDLESVLDECMHAGLMSCFLSWHFRSRHESLIAFSNERYYDGRLHIFPAAKSSARLGVRFVHVPDGVYDARSTRTNRREAEVVADLVAERVKAADCAGKSLGVVTFSEAQRNLIEDLLDERRAADPSLDAAFAAMQDDPFFVKNLENVQGDERDAIIFSIGYAPDANGKFNMVFGPLSNSGGERRLNVAITRAKEQVIVVSSIHAHQIDTSRISSQGPADLRGFLDFAEKYTIAAQNAQISPNNADMDAFADQVAEFLQSNGAKTVRNIGCGSMRIDIAVLDPSDPSKYQLGVICDGESYSAQRTTRDRDRLRDDVLTSLGWRIHHAWVVDWAYDRERAQKRLLAAL